jgi:diguanylate cyclase (GGDEF)-like protein
VDLRVLACTFMFDVAASKPKVVIGVLTPHTGGFYYGTVVNGILEVARQHDAIAIAFETSRLRLLKSGRVLSSARVDGWLAINEFTDPELLAALRARGDRIIHVHSKPDIEDGAVALPDNEGGTGSLTEHLIEHGHRHIAFAANISTHVDMAERFLGYKAAMVAAGLPIDDDLVIDTPHHKEVDGKVVAQMLMERAAGSVTALVAGTDRLALGAMQEFLRMGRKVPEEIVIVGFDDAEAAQFAEPPLTTVRQSFSQVAGCAVIELLSAIREGREPGSIRVPTEPVLRRSCGCLVSHSYAPSALEAGSQRALALTDELLNQAGRNQLRAVTMGDWSQAEKIARAIDASVTGVGAVEAVRGEWWSGFLKYQHDAESAVGVLDLLETTFATWANQAPSAPAPGILRDLRVALMHQWQRTERVKVAHYEAVTEAAYRLASDLSRTGIEPSEDLTWIRWSNAHHACCALWEEPGIAEGVLQMTGEYSLADESPTSSSYSRVSPEEFPPRRVLETADREGAIVSIASVPHGRGGEYGLLAVVAPLAFEHLEYVGTPGNWAAQLGAALDRERAERELRASAELDALTGLPNRATLLRQVEALRTSVHAARFAILLIDVDDFKKVNDSLGHEAGDQLLVQIAARLTEEAGTQSSRDRSNRNLVARVGGDEFAIVLSGIDCEEDAVAAVEQLQAQIEHPYMLQGRTVFISASIGVNFAKTPEADAQELLRDADTAMYRAKMRGRAKHEIFHHGMHTQAMEKLHLDARLRLALEQDELELWYQPIVELAGLADAGAEALIRWRHPEQGLLPPGRFLAIAEDVGLAIPISEWVIRRACTEAARWQPSAGSPLYVNVNVPAAHIKQPGFVEFVQTTLHESGLEPTAFGIEIVESTLLDEPTKSSAALAKLLALGVRVAIDDFGTGYSSLSYLRDFPVTTLKIDRGFVKNLPGNARDSGIARAIIAMGQGLGLGIVAEGIETPEQLKFLTRAGCDYGQGYFISMPLERADYVARLADLRKRHSAPMPRRPESFAPTRSLTPRSTPPRSVPPNRTIVSRE